MKADLHHKLTMVVAVASKSAEALPKIVFNLCDDDLPLLKAPTQTLLSHKCKNRECHASGDFSLHLRAE